jgi:hypothetical protein
MRVSRISWIAAMFAAFVAVEAMAQAPSPSSETPLKPSVGPKATTKKDVEPRVLTADEMKKKGRSSFLSPNGEADKYSGSVPFHELLPWEQTSFYGIRAKAQTVVFVVDCSESMADGECLLRAKRELRRSVEGLVFPQQFTVIFYNEAPILMSGGGMKTIETNVKDALTSWLRLIEPEGGTDPRDAMRIALGLRPDVIYLLSDGLFPDGTVEAIAAKNKRKTPIHCIDLTGGESDQLKRIAKDSGGQYAARAR